MFYSNEFLALVTALPVLLFLTMCRHRVKNIPHIRLLVAGFCSLYLGIIMTVLEEFVLHDSYNLLEHLPYSVSSVLLAVWVWKLFSPEEQR